MKTFHCATTDNTEDDILDNFLVKISLKSLKSAICKKVFIKYILMEIIQPLMVNQLFMIIISMGRGYEILGYVMRRKGIENLSLTGNIHGKRVRGRHRMTYLSNIKEWTKMANGNYLIQTCQEREQ